MNTLHWPGSASGESLQATTFEQAIAENFPPSRTLIEVVSPFGRAELQGIDLNQELYDNPEKGEERLNDLAIQTQIEIARALEAGFKGILYRLIGAEPSKCSPMQYGGHFLEVDREILSKFEQAGTRVVFVEGEEMYFDFVSDLPCEFMGWDTSLNDLSLNEAKEMRPTGFVLDHTDADLKLISKHPAKATN